VRKSAALRTVRFLSVRFADAQHTLQMFILSGALNNNAVNRKRLHMKKMVKMIVMPAVSLWLAGCSEQSPPASAESPAAGRTAAVSPPFAAPAAHGLDARLVARGSDIYKANCAVCHGANAEGAPNWQRKGPDGKLPPPPLDANGHAWHHPSTWLRDTIRQGSVARGGNMPAWEGKLSDDDIAAVIAWIQSRWPEEIYRSWLAMDEKARKGGAMH
jgi:mono/diheme cytochrome c family protein